MLQHQTARPSASSRATSSATATSQSVSGPEAPAEREAEAASTADLWGQSATTQAAQAGVSAASARRAAAPRFDLGTATLRQGARGAGVEGLQRALNHYGARIKVDGDFGPVTHRAVVAFQRANGLLQDGVVGPVTRGVIQGGQARSVSAGPAAAPAPAVAPAPVATPAAGLGTATLRQGAKGPAVEALQRALNGLGARLTVDGDFGRVTHAAVVAFQRANGLQADGVVGAITRGVLQSGRAKSVGAGAGAQAPAREAPGAVLSALGWASSQLGAPYFGGASPFRDGAKPGNGQTYQKSGQSAYVSTLGVIGYDCSGFVTAVMRKAGIELGPQSSSNLKNSFPAVDKGALQPGDLLVKDGHVAIYLGGGQLIESVPKGVSTGSAGKYIGDPAYVGRRVW
jgi:peptidoglycan hydrolase-like protein with peptidoglycan-binding domain